MTGRHEFRNGVTHTILERERLSLQGHDARPGAEEPPATRPASSASGTWATRPPTSPTGAASTRCSSTAPAASGRPIPAVAATRRATRYFDPAILHNGRFEKTKGYCTDVFFGQALQWIDAVKGRQPFFAYITPNAPHAPLECPPEYETAVRRQGAAERGQVLRHDRQHRRQRGPAAGEAEGVGPRAQHAGDLHERQRRHGRACGSSTPACAAARARPGWAARAPRRSGAGRARCSRPTSRPLTAHIDFFPTLAELAGDEARRRGARPGRRPQPGAAAARIRTPPGPTGTCSRTSAAGPKGEPPVQSTAQCSIRNTPLQPASMRQERLATVRSQGRPRRDTRRGGAPARGRAGTGGRLRPVVGLGPALLVNEDAVGPAVNPFKELYWKQFGGGPDEACCQGSP